MDEKKNTPEGADEKADAAPSEDPVPISGGGPRLLLTYDKGYFRVEWSGGDIIHMLSDKLALYEVPWRTDDQYVKSHYMLWAEGIWDTEVPVMSGYDARYLRLGLDGYYCVARTDPWPQILPCSPSNITAPYPVICLFNDGPNFQIAWDPRGKVMNKDEVRLYGASGAMLASHVVQGPQEQIFNTSVPLSAGCVARYLRVIDNQYVIIAETPPYPQPEMDSIDFKFPRKPNSVQWQEIRAMYPKLEQFYVWLTGPMTTDYNCIAWSLGIDDAWIDAPDDGDYQAFISFYEEKGLSPYEPQYEGTTVDGWGFWVPAPDGMKRKMGHASKKYDGEPITDGYGLWESKLGPRWRITHNRSGLTTPDPKTPGAYGDILVSFIYTLRPVVVRDLLQQRAQRMSLIEPLQEGEASAVSEKAAALPEDLKTRFGAAYGAWEATWFQGPHAFSSNTRDLAKGDAFDSLVAMGADIVPLVLEKLLTREKFPALRLYEAVQPEPDLVIRYGPQDPNWLEGEQTRALRTIRLWLAAQ